MVTNYGVLRGNVINAIPYRQGNGHYQVEITAGKNIYRVAINVYSALAGTPLHLRANGSGSLQTDRMVLFYKNENYVHPSTLSMLQLPVGFTPKNKLPSALQLDYLRTIPALFPIGDMSVVAPGSQSAQPPPNLNAAIDPWIQKAKNNASAQLFAFGSGWNDGAAGGLVDPTQYFHPNPLMGVHDIHMNQGDTGSEAIHNGTFQDGCLFIHFKQSDQWVAMFFRFQNQHLQTDDNGNPK